MAVGAALLLAGGGGGSSAATAGGGGAALLLIVVKTLCQKLFFTSDKEALLCIRLRMTPQY